MRSIHRPSLVVLVLAALLVPALPAAAEFPYHRSGVTPGTVYDWADYLWIDEGTCGTDGSTPAGLLELHCTNDWKFVNSREPAGPTQTYDPNVANSPQEFYGVKGVGTNEAWEISTGRPDVVIAVMDSGIQWEDTRANLFSKYYVNRHELPLPLHPTLPSPNPADTRFDGYDVDGNGAFNALDYVGDSRVSDLNGNGQIDPEDLIRIFSDGVDDDGNGYVDDISGWDFYENDNNPQDDVDYGHGTGEAVDSTAEAGKGGDGQCPNCMMMPMRVGDSFVADVNHFAEAVVYAVDNGAGVVQEALGTLNHSSYGQAAVDYAYRNGVIVNASEADEAAGHHMWPAAYDHTMVVNSIRTPSLPSTRPYSYMYFNGCTNFGGYTFVAIPSTSCSSEATGRSSGISGLLQSAARNAVERGELRNYVRDDGTSAAFALSAEELRQLWRLSADDIDFSSPTGVHPFTEYAPTGTIPAAPPNNYATSIAVPSTRYQTVQGWDYFTGYGRSNAARLLRFIGNERRAATPGREYVDTPGTGMSSNQVQAPNGFGEAPTMTAEDRIPPEADIQWPRWWHGYGYDTSNELLLPDDPTDPGKVVVHGRVAANRVTKDGGTFDWVLEWAPHVQGERFPLSQDSTRAPTATSELSTGPWTRVAGGEGRTSALEGELGRIDVAAMATALQRNPNPFDPATDPTSEYQPEKYAVRLRVRVISHPANATDTINNEAVMQKQIDVYPATEEVMRDDIGVPLSLGTDGIGMQDGLNSDAIGRYAGGAGSPSFHDLDGDGIDELLLPTTDGLVHAYTDVVTGEELPGWPVFTDPYQVVDRLDGDGTTPVDNAYTRGEVTDQVFGSILLGTLAVADLDDDGTLEATVADMEGRLYVFEHDGTRRPGFPVFTRDLATEPPCGPATIPACDDYAPKDRRNKFNQRDWGINSAPAIGDLDPTTPGLEIVSGSNDGHVYAWHEDGTPVPGWPVILRDPAKVATMDAETRLFTHVPDSGVAEDSKILVSPSLGDIDGDGDLEVVIGVNEQYVEAPNSSLDSDPLVEVLAQSGQVDPGNTRVYALHHTGALTAHHGDSETTPHTQDQAYVTGWPVPITLLLVELLPYVAAGPDTQAALYDADDDGTLEIVVASADGPGYILDHDGSSWLGETPDGKYRTLQANASSFGRASTANDGSSFIALGGMAVGSLDGGTHMSIAAPGAGIRRLLDVALEADQASTEDHLLIWNGSVPTGQMEENSPIIVNDLQFFAHPTIADLNGDGLAEVFQSTSVGDAIAVGLAPSQAATRHFTGGWTVASSAVGDAPTSDGYANFHWASVTREGYLRLWPTGVATGTSAACDALTEWPEYGHDARNTGNYLTDAERPYPIRDAQASVPPPGGRDIVLSWKATGDDRNCFTADHYELRRVDAADAATARTMWQTATAVTATLPTPSAPGSPQTVTVTEDGPDPGFFYLLRAYDEAGNGSAVAAIPASVPTAAPQVTLTGPATGTATTGQAATFAATVTDADSPGGPFAYTWSATGSGAISGTGASVTVTWPAAAAGQTHTVNVVVTDPDLNAGSDSRSVAVQAPGGGGTTNRAPLANAGPATRSVLAGSPVTFDGSQSVDPDGDTITFTWSADATDAAPSSGSSPQFTTTFEDTGEAYETVVTLTVRDPSGLTGSDTVTVTVSPDNAPIAVAGADRRWPTDEAVPFDGSGSVDPEGDALSYSWDFGDGATGTGETTTHRYAAPGDYEVTLTVTDGAGQSDSDTLSIHSLDVNRVAGASRVETAVEVSRDGFESATEVVLAFSGGYADALAGAPLARQLGGPVLLNPTGALHPSVKAELARLGTTKATLLGGTGVLSEQVARDLEAENILVERIAGPNRYATAAAVAERIDSDEIFVVEGANADPGRGWPDAISAAPLAAFIGAPVVLVEAGRLPGETRELLETHGATKATIVGGPGAVSQEVAEQIDAIGLDVLRVAGRTRYETSQAVATRALLEGMDTIGVWLGTGRDYPDTLAAGPTVAAKGVVMLLIDGHDLDGSPSTRDWLTSRLDTVSRVVMLGGPNTIRSEAETQLRTAVRR